MFGVCFVSFQIYTFLISFFNFHRPTATKRGRAASAHRGVGYRLHQRVPASRRLRSGLCESSPVGFLRWKESGQCTSEVEGQMLPNGYQMVAKFY